MNLQHWIDQHPAVFAAIFPIYFLCLWLLVGAATSFVGGWFSLAKVYRTRVPFNGTKWRGQSGQMRWLANYNRVLTLGTSQEGLYLASKGHRAQRAEFEILVLSSRHLSDIFGANFRLADDSGTILFVDTCAFIVC